jgi:hypothetical protein
MTITDPLSLSMGLRDICKRPFGPFPAKKRHAYRRFARQPVRGANYPAVVHMVDSVVDGLLVCPKSQEERNKFDNFEGEGESYKRVLVHDISEDGEESEAFVYLWAGPEDNLEEGCQWDYKRFGRERLDDWLMIFDVIIIS